MIMHDAGLAGAGGHSFWLAIGRGQKMVIADLNVGILYTFGIVSLGVYGIVLAGYASNSKYPFLGGIRSSAQMISYEIAMGMSVIPVFLMVGDLNLSQVIAYQAQHGWLILYAPVSFVIFLISSFAETNRLPFDLPESEQELVGGYNTEYSSMKFALFFMGEYANMIAASAMMVTLVFGRLDAARWPAWTNRPAIHSAWGWSTSPFSWPRWWC